MGTESTGTRREERGAFPLLLAALKVVKLIHSLDPPDAEAFGAWFDQARSGSVADWLESADAVGVEPRPGLVATWLALIIQDWETGAWQWLDFMESVYNLELDKGKGLAEELVQKLIEALNEASWLEQKPGKSEELYNGNSILALGEMLLEADHAALALDVADGLAALAATGEIRVRVRALRLAATAAFAADLSAQAALRLAALAAVSDDQGDAETFDLVETCLRWLPEEEEGALETLALLQRRMKGDPALAPLIAYWSSWFGGRDRAETMPELRALDIVRPVINSSDLPRFMSSAHQVSSFLGDIERARLALLPDPVAAPLKTDWGTFSFRHRAFLRSVPIGDALRFTTQGEDIALLVHHETTHILSMVGAIGWSLLAIRAAILECELFLAAGGKQERERLKPLGTEEPLSLEGLRALGRHGPATLLDVERQLDLIRKTQVISDLWQPWFEGIAVFAELCDDTEEDVYSHSIAVLYNLFDLGAFQPGGAVDQSAEGLFAHMAGVDRYYRQAVEQGGHFRLRSYLNPRNHRDHYLPGYLAVRRVAAAWRSMTEEAGLDAPDGGTIARILLHATRFGTADTIPLADLPIEAFEKAAQEAFEGWTTSLLAVPPDDLRMLAQAYHRFDGSTAAFGWVQGKLVRHETPQEDSAVAQFNQMAEAAIGSLVTSNADPTRIGSADNACSELVSITSAAVANARAGIPKWRTDLWQQVMQPYSILELAEIDCPFWLLREAPAVAVFLRTSEHDSRTGQSSHKMLSFPLTKDQAGDLEREVRRHGKVRMRVRRVADLAQRATGTDTGSGRQYLVFDYFAWRLVVPVGLRFGADANDPAITADIARRLDPGALSRLDQLELASGRGPAERAREWLESAREWDSAGYPIGPWVAHVRQRAETILLPADQRGNLNQAGNFLLRFALGSERLADQVRADGLGALLKSADADSLSALFQFMDASARRPMMTLPDSLMGMPFAVKRRHGWDFDAAAAEQRIEETA